MKNFHGREHIWTISGIHNGKVVWSETNHNIIPDEGEKAMVDTFYRKNDSLYFAADMFYVGLYKGSISEATTLATIPLEPTTSGYVRQPIARSSVGWPTIEKNEGDWRVVSSTITISAVGENLGPVNGAFLCTSLDETGVLLGAIAMKVDRTIPAGDNIQFVIRAKQK